MRKEDAVRLISAEGFEFVIDKRVVMVSQTISNILTSPGSFAETRQGEVTFPEISTTVLEKICHINRASLESKEEESEDESNRKKMRREEKKHKKHERREKRDKNKRRENRHSRDSDDKRRHKKDKKRRNDYD